jgi:23S rRNA pseudouridine1911/1915/1917 synthase
MAGEMTEQPAKDGAPVHLLDVVAEEEGMRLDVFLHGRLGDHSRTWLKELIRRGEVRIEGREEKPSYRVATGERVEARISPRIEHGPVVPQDIPVIVLHEDAAVLVIDKPASLVVHPGSGRHDGTLANALAYRFKELSDAGGEERPGIVHRLDRDTTGVMVIAKTNRSHFSLAAQFQERTIHKEYLAIVEGCLALDRDEVDLPLGRCRRDPSRVVADVERGKASVTRYEVLERFRGYTLVRCLPRTGRTHQIRVHMQSLGHPVVCDPVYGRRARIRLSDLGAASGGGSEDRVLLERQGLHAHRLSFFHPLDGERRSYEAPLPDDMKGLLEALGDHRPPGKGEGRR